VIRKLSTMRRLAFLALLTALFVTGTALAARGDPERRITRADEARAKAMLVRQADLPGSSAGSAGVQGDFYCPALDASDLTLTGDATGRRFALGIMFVGSASQVYESVADAGAFWRRATGAAGVRCATSALRREFAQQGVRLVSLRTISFPRVSDRTSAFRVRLTATTPQGEVPAYVDLVALMRSRAHATVVVGSALTPPPRSEELRLARIVAKRMASAMRRA
jgi:hypothetical protein